MERQGNNSGAGTVRQQTAGGDGKKRKETKDANTFTFTSVTWISVVRRGKFVCFCLFFEQILFESVYMRRYIHNIYTHNDSYQGLKWSFKYHKMLHRSAMSFNLKNGHRKWHRFTLWFLQKRKKKLLPTRRLCSWNWPLSGHGWRLKMSKVTSNKTRNFFSGLWENVYVYSTTCERQSDAPVAGTCF